MTRPELVAVVPCRNEAESIRTVITDLRSIRVDRIIVALDPKSSDATASLAADLGVDVVVAERSGYDGPCLSALRHLRSRGYRGSVLFLDAGNKYNMDSVGELLDVVDPSADITFGIRDTQWQWHQRTGNLLFRAAVLVRYRHNMRDVSSVRVATMSVLDRLNYEDRQFSLPFQTVIHALHRDMTLRYVPIRCTQNRTGLSKVSGQWRNSLRAAKQMGLSFLKVR